MSSYVVQINICDRWVDMAPKGRDPYRFHTRAEAERCSDSCYPHERRARRLGGEEVVRVAEDPNPPNFPRGIY